MKQNTHPDNYRLVVFKDTSCDYAFLTKSTVETKETIKWDDGKEYPLCKIEISNIIAKDLKKENIFFAGIDFIDQKLNGDINVTSPTGLKTLFELSGKNLAKTFWKELKA